MEGALPFSAIILAGGDSKRMGTKKAFLKIGKRSLVEIVFYKLKQLFSEVIIVSDNDNFSKFDHLKGAVVTEDFFKEEEKSALRGIQAGLAASTNNSNFITACDTPFLSLPLIEYMSIFAHDYDVVVPSIEEYYQPLFAFYHSNLFNSVTAALREKRYKVSALYSGLKVKEIEKESIKFYDPSLSSFYNINTKEAYLKAIEYFEGKKC